MGGLVIVHVDGSTSPIALLEHLENNLVQIRVLPFFLDRLHRLV
jgi:hypothetical protein